jgi:DNA uptake protein ComE-like DNA-binding protein
MCIDSQDEVIYVEEENLIPHLDATNEKIQTEERLTEQLKQEGVKPAKPTNKETFPLDARININTASARQIADTLPGVGLKTARDIKDLQTSMPGEKFQKLDQLTSIKRVDWEEIFKENSTAFDFVFKTKKLKCNSREFAKRETYFGNL